MLEHQAKYDGTVFLLDDDREQLRGILDDDAFIDAVEKVTAWSSWPAVRFIDKKTFAREVNPAITLAKKLREHIGSVEGMSRMLYYIRHRDLVNNLSTFIDDFEAKVEERMQQPDKTKGKKRWPRDVVRRLAEVFEEYGLTATTYEQGPFQQTVEIVFAAVNRETESKVLPKDARQSILDTL
jgi:hypothetical protein